MRVLIPSLPASHNTRTGCMFPTIAPHMCTIISPVVPAPCPMPHVPCSLFPRPTPHAPMPPCPHAPMPPCPMPPCPIPHAPTPHAPYCSVFFWVACFRAPQPLLVPVTPTPSTSPCPSAAGFNTARRVSHARHGSAGGGAVPEPKTRRTTLAPTRWGTSEGREGAGDTPRTPSTPTAGARARARAHVHAQ
jgi:hypothetical protein